MQHQTFLGAALALLGLSQAVPVELSAPVALQTQIINLQQTIVYLTNDFVQADAEAAKSDFTSGDKQFQSISAAVLTPSTYACPPPTSQGRITTLDSAVNALNTTQNNLADLSLHLQGPSSAPQLINDDFCDAYANFQAVNYYTFTIVGTPQNGAANVKVAASFTQEGYNANKLGATYTASLVALEGLISALNIITPSDPSSAEAKTAFRNAQSTVATYRAAANPRSDTECPQVKLIPATDPKSAIDYVYVVERAVQSAYADTTANNGNAFGDFCKIDTYLTGVNSYVQA